MCARANEKRPNNEQAVKIGRLLVRPRKPSKTGEPGVHALNLRAERDCVIYVPESYRPENAMPLAISLHGAGRDATRGLNLLREYAESDGFILLAPASTDRTWDMVMGEFGPDVAALDHALEWTFDRYAVKRGKIAIGGFSDGASYAISLGLINGDLFSHVLAFSPGFLITTKEHGRPELFISHGKSDQVLPIEKCSRQIVPRLREAGYRVKYSEFAGPHTAPPELRREAVSWFLG
jgi:predicted esterase